MKLILKPKIKVNFTFIGDGTNHNTVIQTSRLKETTTTLHLRNIAAKDRQTPWDADVYMNPTNMTIPQTVGRIGYFFHDHWNISVGVDHMK